MNTDHYLPPPSKTWGLFAILLVLDTAAQIFFKFGAAARGPFPTDSGPAMLAYIGGLATNPFILGGIASLLGAFLLWLIIISQVDLSEAHPITCLVYGTVAIASAVFLGETFSWHQALGVVLIIVGAFVTSEP